MNKNKFPILPFLNIIGLVRLPETQFDFWP